MECRSDVRENEELMGRKIAYDGSAQNFGASHPRYVNYLERDGTTAKANTLAGTGSGIAFSNSVPEQTVRGSDTSPTSASHDMSLETSLKVAPSPFVFNMERVSGAVARVLLEKGNKKSTDTGKGKTKAIKKRQSA